jgi:hypothetical protein
MYRSLLVNVIFALCLAVPSLVQPGSSGAQESTPSALNAAVTEEPVYSWNIPAEMLPTGDVEGVFYRLTLPPEASMPLLLGPYCTCSSPMVEPGIGVEMVEAGTYTIRLDAPFTVVRDGVEEEFSVGTEATLGPGDVARFPDYAASGELRNAGSDAVSVLGLAMLSSGSDTGTPVSELPQGAVSTELAHVTPADWSNLPPGPLTVSLRRLSLSAGAVLAPYEPAGLESILVEDGEISLAFIPVGETEPSSPLVYREDHASPFLSTPPGTRRVVRNDGQAPAALLVLTIAPADAARTPAAA